MAEKTGIEWTTHTQNFWTGCQEIDPACDNCYARDQWAKRAGRDFHERRRTTPQNWRAPFKWDLAALTGRRRDRVFTNSLADFLDNQVPEEWRDDACDVIERCESLDWQILTKRPQNAPRLLARWMKAWPAHAWIGASAGTRDTLERNLRHLCVIPAKIRFLSLEPLLEDLGTIDLTGISWVIAGGESGPNARPMHPDWARALRDQCVAAGVPYFLKQWGEWVPDTGWYADHPVSLSQRWLGASGAWTDDGAHFTGDEEVMVRVGKKRAGATLDGREWRQFPAPRA